MEPPSGPIVDVLTNWFIWFFIGAAILFFVGMWAKKLTDIILPGLPMVVGCIFIGGVAVAAVAKLMS